MQTTDTVHVPPSRLRGTLVVGTRREGNIASTAGGIELSQVTGNKTGTEEARDKRREDHAENDSGSMHQYGEEERYRWVRRGVKDVAT